MDLTIESKACAACAKAKRRCGKQIPACSRCESRGVSCEYPSVKTYCLPPRQPGGESRDPRRQEDTAVLDTPLDASVPASDTPFDLPGEAMVVEDDMFALDSDAMAVPSPLGVMDLNPKRPCLPWYLEPSSWEIDHLEPSASTHPFCNTVLMNHIEQIQDWQARWVHTGSSPYIHKLVYKFQQPRCVQDAYTMLAAYLHRTPENRGTIEVLLEERIRQLRRDQPAAGAGEDDGPDAHQSLSTFEHMARVHALHTYQTICLFDGAIRMRHVAETQIPTLNRWLRQLMASARASAARGPDAFVLSLLLPPRGEVEEQQRRRRQQWGPRAPEGATDAGAGAGGPGGAASMQLTPEDAAWLAWAFAETIRRTWEVACATQTIYLTLQLRWAPCPGRARSTARGGLWGADTAFAWAEAAAAFAGEGGGGGGGGDGLDFVSRGSWGEILERRTPDDVDEYLQAALQLTFGLDRMARWRAAARARAAAGG